MSTTTRRGFMRGVAAAGALAASGPARAADAPPEKKLGVAIVGIGKLSGRELIPALKRTKACKLTALVSGHPDKARAVAAENGVPEKNIYTYETFDRLADNPDVDVVYVVLPNAMHAEFTIRAARAGKHVFCEKPMAVSVRECEEMIAACKKAKRLLGIAYRPRYEPHNLEMARLAREKDLGALRVIEAAGCTRVGEPGQWRLDKKLSGGGSLVDIGIYALQAARYISGEEPLSVSARQTVTDRAKFKGIDETIVWSMSFPSGVLANCVSSYAIFHNRFAAAAEGGRFWLDPALNYRGIRGFRSDDKPLSFPDNDMFAAEMDDFARCARDGTPTRVPGEEGLRDMRIIEAIYRSAETGREVKVPGAAPAAR